MATRPSIDLRSDTVTQPTPEMRKAIAAAEVGDDVFGDDPTVNRLQDRVAEMMGKQAALFVPSGSMANQTAIRALTEPGDEIIAHQDTHSYHYEAAGTFAISGCSMRLLPGERGLFTADQVRAAVRPPDSHFPRTRLVIIENTHNRGGGSIWPMRRIEQVYDAARAHRLAMHLDGARLMNACVATGTEPAEYAHYFDTVSMCFSKGLGAPVGSIVAGSVEVVRRVHRFRKMFGGGMRQAGVLAAAALYALDQHVDRLADDHAHAKRLAAGVAEMPGLSIDPATVETNIVYFDVDESVGSAAQLSERLSAAGVRMLPIAPQRIRAVTHLHITQDDIDRSLTTLRDCTRAAVSAR